MDEETRREALIAQLNDELGPSLARQFLALADAAPINDAAFRAASFEYFDRHAAAKRNPDTYFNWIGKIALPRPETPLANNGLWEWALSIAHEWAESRNAHQHRGSGYYFAGMRSIALGDIDRGFLYMHQAAVENTPPIAIGFRKVRPAGSLPSTRVELTRRTTTGSATTRCI
jgi:hypothetical protein